MRKHLLLLQIWLIMLFFSASCSTDPKPINYGNDACDFCRMTIVDKQHAAQIVTKTGKAYKYDAIECMLNDLKDWEHPEVKYYLVSDYSNPGSLTNASDAFYLISKAIPSPMGEFLTAFSDPKERAKKDSLPDDEHLNWSQLKDRFDLN